MELLVIKSGKDYIRVKAESYIPCRLDKASVFPFGNLKEVRAHINLLREKGFHRLSISKLMLSESLFENHDCQD